MAPKILGYCFACVRSIPVVFITAIIIWSYYAFVVQMCFNSKTSTLEKFIYLTCFHPLLIMMMWSYWQSIFTPVAIAPKSFHLGGFDIERLSAETNTTKRREILMQIGRTLPIQMRTLTGEIRYCEKCKAIRPDRAHHCSVCGQCILKMDHHCPWVNNCVNFANYKYFCLFLGYALAYSLFVALTSLQYFIIFWQNQSPKPGAQPSDLRNLHVVFLFFAGIMFAISLMTLFGYHVYLLSNNRSTLEAFQVPIFAQVGPDKKAFDLGCYRNFTQVFGTRKLYWFLPIFTGSGDGITFPMKDDDDATSRLLGQQQRWVEEGETDDGQGADDESHFVTRS